MTQARIWMFRRYSLPKVYVRAFLVISAVLLSFFTWNSTTYCATPGTESKSKSQEDPMKRYLKNGDIQEGLHEARLNMKTFRDSYWREWVVIFSIHSGHVNKRVQKIARACVNDSDDRIHALSTLSMVFAQTGKIESAINVARKVLEADRDNARAMASLALALSKRGEPEEADRLMMKAISDGGGNEDVMFLACNFYERQGRLSDALNALELWTQLKPNSAYAHYMKGHYFDKSLSMSRAKAEFEKAISLNPNYWSAKKDLASVLTYQKDFKRAAVLYESILRAGKGSAASYVHYAECLEALGKNLQALEKYTLALNKVCYTRDPQEAIKAITHIKIGRRKWAVQAGAGRVRMLMETGSLEQALNEANQLSVLLSSSLEPRYMKMLVLMRMKKYDLALREINLLIADEKDIPLFFLKRAEIHRMMNKPEEAVRDVVLARRLQKYGSIEEPGSASRD